MGIEFKETFFSLLRLGIGNVSEVQMPENVDWSALEALAKQHKLSAILVDGVEQLPEDLRPPKPVLLQWIGKTLRNFDYRYRSYRRAIAEMAAFYNRHGYEMMVLKGYACCLDWPKPEHRHCGDIDIWQFGKSDEADALLAKRIKIDKNHHHHTVFYWRKFMVENHYDFINVHHHRSNAEFEKILKELADYNVLEKLKGQSRAENPKQGVPSQLKGCSDAGCKFPSVEVYGERVWLPSANLHALFLLKHTMMHFAAEEIYLRQLLDWAFFVQVHGKDVDWPWLEGVLDRFGMRQLYEIFNAICVEDFGFPVSMFQHFQSDPVLKEKVLKEILEPEFSGELTKSVFKRVTYKIRRWRGNAWKHRLCYRDSMWSAFWSGVWNHLLKPSSI